MSVAEGGMMMHASRRKGKRLQVWLDNRHYEFLRDYAEQEGQSVADIIRRWIEHTMVRAELAGSRR